MKIDNNKKLNVEDMIKENIEINQEILNNDIIEENLIDEFEEKDDEKENVYLRRSNILEYSINLGVKFNNLLNFL